jgi:hypothetical protein
MAVIFFQNKHYPNALRDSQSGLEFKFPHTRGVAYYNDDTHFASGVGEGGDVHYVNFPSATFLSVKEWVGKTFDDNEPIESGYTPGTVFKRMYRPHAAMGNFYRAISQEKLTESFVSLRILLNKLEQLFEVIEPTQENLTVYGHKIREILLLACMEVESSWSAVLKENGYSTNGQLLTTRDYVKLLVPMLLDSYELTLQQYPRFPSFSPFKNWDVSHPTQSLVWYDAYNKTKHDREENLKFATLNNSVQAVGAAVVMIHAQFSLNFGLGPSHMLMDQKSPVIKNIFRTVTNFQNHWQECYIPKMAVLPNSSPTPTPSFDWEPVNYNF